MANQILTTSMILNEALTKFVNANPFMRRIKRTYSDEFARTGAKIGYTLNLRNRVDYTVRTGPTAVPQNTVESVTPLTIAYQQGVDLSFSTADLTMSVDDFSDRYLDTAVNNLAAVVASNIMSMVDGGTGNGPAQHLVHNIDANNNTTPPTMSTYLLAGAKLVNNGYPKMDRLAINSPETNTRLVPSLATLFNPARDISDQYRDGVMGQNVLGIADFMTDVTVINHQVGSFTSGAVNGAGQTGNVLAVNAITGTLNQGDIITIAGVYAVNRLTKLSTNTLKQFAVTAPVASGATSIPISPAITPYTVIGGQNTATQMQTVANSPATGAAVSLVCNPNEVHRTNLVFAPEAFTLATVDMDLPGGPNGQGVVSQERQNYQGISMRMVQYYTGNSDQAVTRLDILYGYALIRPEWAVRVLDAI